MKSLTKTALRGITCVISIAAAALPLAALADTFNSTPTRVIGPTITGQSGTWTVADDRTIGPSLVGQQGWSDGSPGCNSQNYDQEVSHAAAHTGDQSLRLSNWYAAGCVDSLISPAFTPAGETNSVTAANTTPASNSVAYDFWFRSVSTSVDPGNDFVTGLSGLASYRQTYLEAYEETPGDATSGCANVANGCFHLIAIDIVPKPGDPDPTHVKFNHYTSPDLARGAWYHVVINATFVDGSLNDQIHTQVFDANNASVWNVTTGSWEYAYLHHIFGASPNQLAVDHATIDMASTALVAAGNYSNSPRPLGVYVDDMSVTPGSGSGFSTSFDTDRYVNASGGSDASNNCLTQANPCATIAHAIAQATPYNVIHIAKGTYVDALTITLEGLQLIGNDPANKPLIQHTSGGTNQQLLIINGAKNVRVENLNFNLDQSFIAEGIIANGFVDGLNLINNHFGQTRSNAANNSTYGFRNAISINDDNGNSAHIGGGQGSNVTIAGNVIDGLLDIANGVFLRCGIDMDNGTGVFSNNTITTGVHDIRVRFTPTNSATSTLTTTIDGNTLNGRGLEFDTANTAAGAVNITNNHINATAGINGTTNYPADYSLMRMIGNAPHVPVNISGNFFAGFQGAYRGVLLENFPGAVVSNNTFTPAAGAADFFSLVISNKELNSNSPPSAPAPMSVLVQGNHFNGSGVFGAGRAVELIDDNDANGTATFGSLLFGGSGAGQANNFDGNLRWYFHLDDHNCETVTTPCTFLNYSGDIGSNAGTNTDVRPFATGFNAANNLFAGVAPSAMSQVQVNALLARTYDKNANALLGMVDYGVLATEPVVYVDDGFSGSYGDPLTFVGSTGSCTGQVVYFGINAFANANDGLAHVITGGIVCVAKGAYPAAVSVTKLVQFVGDGSLDANPANSSVFSGGITLAASGTLTQPLLLQNLRVTGVPGVGISLMGNESYISIDGVVSSTNVGDGLHAFGPGTTDHLTVTNSHFDGNGHFPPQFAGDLVAGFNFGENASASNVSISGSTFDGNNGAGLVVNNIGSPSSLTTIQHWTITGSDFSRNVPLDPADPNLYTAGGGIWLKTSAANSVIDDFTVSGSTFADNGTGQTNHFAAGDRKINANGISVRARPNTTLTNVHLCGNTYSETAVLGTQLYGVYVFDDTAAGGTYQPVEICGANTVNGLVEGISGYEQYASRGSEPFVNLSGTINNDSGDAYKYIQLTSVRNTVYVDDDFAGHHNGDAVSFTHPLIGTVAASYGDNAFATIHEAIARVAVGGTIYVAKGTYAESSGANQNLVVNKSVSVLGEQATVDARTRGGAESVIIPSFEDANHDLNSLTSSAVVHITADNVTFDGFTIDADNPALNSSVTINGSNPDADTGILIAQNGSTLTNLIVRNTYGSAIFGGDAVATVFSDNRINHNRFENMPAPSGNGRAVMLYYNYYASVTDNLFNNVRIGVYTENHWQPVGGSVAAEISRNEIHASRSGVWHNNFYSDASTFSIADNQLFAAVPPAGGTEARGWSGIWIQSMQSAQTVSITTNHADGTALVGGRSTVGYLISNAISSATSAIDGGSVDHVDIGVLGTDATYYTGAVNDFIVRNVAFSNVALGALYVEDTTEQTGSAKLTVGGGNFYTNVAHDLVLAGAAPAVGFTDSQTGVDEVFVRAATTFFNATPAQNGTTYHDVSAPINTGIAAANVGGTVDVEAGTFAQNVVVNNTIFLKGPQAGIAGYDPSRIGSNEAVISPSSGSALTLAANNAVVDGFTVTQASGVAVVPGGSNRDNLQFINNRVRDIANGVGIRFEPGEGTPAQGLQISRNLFAAINGSSLNGDAVQLYKGTRNAVVSDNHFDSVQNVALQINGGSGSVQGVTVSGNIVRDPLLVHPNDAFVFTNVNNLSVLDNDVQGVNTGLFLSDADENINLRCNAVVANTIGLATSDFFSNTPNTNVRIYHNSIIANSDISNGMTQQFKVGSNFYGGSAPTVNGSNAVGVQVATALPASPIGNPNCGDNVTVGAVLAVSGTPQTTTINTPFSAPLKARVVDQLGGSIEGVTLGFAAPGAGPSATLSPTSGSSDFDGVLPSNATANGINGSYAVFASTTGGASAQFNLTNSGTPSVALTLNGPQTGLIAGVAQAGYTAQLSNTGAALSENVLVDFVITRSGGFNAGDVNLEYDQGGGHFASIPLQLCQTSNLCGSFGPPGTGFAVAAGYNSTTPLRFTSKRAGANTLTANVDGVSSAASYANSALTVNVAAAAAAIIAANSSQSIAGVAGTSAAPLPSVVVTDQFANPVAGYTVNFTPGANSGTLSGASQVTNASGIATLGNWTLGSATSETVSASGTTVLTGAPVLFTATVSAQVDLAVSFPGNNHHYVQYGRTLDYTILVANNGVSTATNAVTDNLPAELDPSTATWICFANTANASCGASSGTGNLNDTPTIGANGSVTYVLSATVLISAANEVISNQVNVDTTSDANSGNNSASIDTQIVIFRDGFESGGNGAEDSTSVFAPGGSLDSSSTFALNVAAAPAASDSPSTWMRAVDASWREVFRVEQLKTGDTIQARVVSSNANGYELRTPWQPQQSFAIGLASAGGQSEVMLAGSQGNLQVPVPAWATLPLSVYLAQ